ncbi:MAG TPA: ATP-binding protein [Pirellulaceae bacterium]|nr:ATP-binding protein [Pirellulaceae bacterium]
MDRSGSEPSPQEQLAALKQQLLQAQKLTALGELVSTTTHEFNNVLMTILNYAKMGLRHKDDATRDKALTKILDAAQRAAKITNSVLGVARNRSSQFEPTNLAKIVEETLVLLEREMTKYRIAVETHLPAVPEVLAIGNQIQQVLLNLLINARQAMPSGGRVTIRLEHDAKSNMVDLFVRDTGSGIPADKLPRIFEPFYSTKQGPDESGKGGTGLGLSACRSIIEAHRGRIRVNSSVGKGTEFILKLPVAGSVGTGDPAADRTSAATKEVTAETAPVPRPMVAILPAGAAAATLPAAAAIPPRDGVVS